MYINYCDWCSTRAAVSDIKTKFLKIHSDKHQEICVWYSKCVWFSYESKKTMPTILLNIFFQKKFFRCFTSQNKDEDVQITQNNSNNQQPVEMKLNFLFVYFFRQQVNTLYIYLFVFLPVSVSFFGKETLYLGRTSTVYCALAFNFQCIMFLLFCIFLLK